MERVKAGVGGFVASLLILTSCGSSDYLIRQSDIALSTRNEKHVYFLNCPTGELLWKEYNTGAYGKVQAHLVDSLSFYKLVELRTR